MKTVISFLLVVSIFPCVALSVDIHVPSGYSTIQDGIDAAGNNDNVLVAPGTYNEIIDFKGKAITVKSTGGSIITIIDGNQMGSVVTFKSGETRDSILEGFSLINGSGYKPPYTSGGAIYCEKSSPTIKRNEIKNNAAVNCSGIYCTNASPLIIYNLISDNMAAGPGGAIYCSVSKAEIYSNVMINNSAGNAGGAICIDILGEPLIINNIIAFNTVNSQGGGICCNGGFGVSPLIANNVIYGNSASEGGGVCAKYDSSPILIDSIIWSNTAGAGAQLCIKEYTGKPSSLTIDYSNVEGGSAQVYIGQNCTLNYGVGMIDKNPLFINPSTFDFHLMQDPCQPGVVNPCVDAGSDTAYALGFTSAWTRTDSKPDSGVVDMGYHYGAYPSDHISLISDITTISEATGGVANLSLNATSSYANRIYLMLGAISGVSPGTTLPNGLILPLNWDLFTDLIVNFLNTTSFSQFYGALNSSGKGLAQFNTLGPIPGMSGLTMSFAFTLLSPLDFISNAVSISITP